MSSCTSPSGFPGRRHFLTRSIVAVHTFIGATIASVVGGAALGPSFGSRRSVWLRAAALGDLADEEPRAVTLRIVKQDGYRQVVERRVVYLRRDGDTVRVLDSTCTHLV